MKKFIVIALALIMAVSCTCQNKEYSRTNQSSGIIMKNISGGFNYYFDMIEITYNGESHEYIKGTYSLTHWEGCKYCKEKKSKED